MGVLKVKFGSNEVIATVMLNSIVTYLVDYLLNGPMAAENSSVAQTERVLETAQLPRIFQQYQLTIAILLAVAACILVKLFMDRTALGYEIRAVGLNPDAAETGRHQQGQGHHRGPVHQRLHRGPGRRQPCAGRGPPPDQRLLQRLRLLRHLRGRPGGGQPRGRHLCRHRVRRAAAGTMELNRTTSIPVEFVNVIQAMVVILVAAPLLVKELKRLNPAGWSRKTKKEVA